MDSAVGSRESGVGSRESADPVTDRTVTVEVKAEIAK